MQRIFQPYPWARRLYTKAKANACARGIEFNLTWEEMRALAERSEDRCAMTGIPFFEDRTDGKRRPFAASLDRIDSAKGYTVENCRLVCCAVNFALNEWGEDVFRTICGALIKTDRERGFTAKPQLGEYGKALGETLKVRERKSARHYCVTKDGIIYARLYYKDWQGKYKEKKRRVTSLDDVSVAYEDMRREVESL